MRLVGNVLWLVLAGFWLAIAYVVAGIVNCLTVIGIPFGVQAFKLAGYVLWPFGRVVVAIPGRDAALGCVGNGLWFVLGGVWLALGHVLAGLVLCLTVVGIPFGVASFKMAGLALAPFGKRVVAQDRLPPGAAVAAAGPRPLGPPIGPAGRPGPVPPRH